jgi:hypothetical protein
MAERCGTRKKTAIARRSQPVFSCGRDNFRGATLARHAKPHRYPRRIPASKQACGEIARPPAEQHQALKRFHRKYRRVRSMAVRRRIASRFWSPVSFALRTLTLRWECTKGRITRKFGRKTRASHGDVSKKLSVFSGTRRGQVRSACARARAERRHETAVAGDQRIGTGIVKRGHPSSCCASMSLLKAIRRSRATAAK